MNDSSSIIASIDDCTPADGEKRDGAQSVGGNQIKGRKK